MSVCTWPLPGMLGFPEVSLGEPGKSLSLCLLHPSSSSEQELGNGSPGNTSIHVLPASASLAREPYSHGLSRGSPGAWREEPTSPWLLLPFPLLLLLPDPQQPPGVVGEPGLQLEQKAKTAPCCFPCPEVGYVFQGGPSQATTYPLELSKPKEHGQNHT